MAVYTGKSSVIARPVEKVYERMADFTAYGEMVDRLPDDVKAKIGDVKFDADGILINTPPVGEIRLSVVERVPPERVVLLAENSPVPLHMSISLAPTPDGGTQITPAIDVEVPAMLKPFIGPKMQQAADQFGSMLSNLFTLPDA